MISNISNKNRGSVLLLCLIILTLTTLVVISTIGQSILQIRMVSNEISREIAFNTAKREIISQYNFITSNDTGTDFIKQAMDSFSQEELKNSTDQNGYYQYKPIVLPQRGLFQYSDKQVMVQSELRHIPTTIRFDHQLSPGYTTASTKGIRFRINTIGYSDQNIQSKHEVQFEYRMQKER